MDFIQGEKFIHLQNENIVYCAIHDVNQFCGNLIYNCKN